MPPGPETAAPTNGVVVELPAAPVPVALVPAEPPATTNAPSAAAATIPPATNNITSWIRADLWAAHNHATLPVLQAGSKIMRVHGVACLLGFEPVTVSGALRMHPLDVAKNLGPLLLDHPIWTNRSIVIDAGHGGISAGTRAITGNRFEKDFTLDWARRLKPLLESRGWKVFLTRTNDADVSLSDRVRIAEASGASLFLSLHFNSSFPSQAASGLETYCLTPQGMPSTLVRQYSDDPNAVFPNNRHDADNLRLALRVQRAVLAASGATDRGVRRARFMDVLRGQNRPAVLVEGGYLSNPEEARKIGTAEYRQRLALGVARALE